MFPELERPVRRGVARQNHGSLKVLDALAGCGVRSLRYWLESDADYLWGNEGNPQLSSLLQQNLAQAIAANCCQITHQDAYRVFFDCHNRRDYYDLVDVDCFGTTTPYFPHFSPKKAIAIYF